MDASAFETILFILPLLYLFYWLGWGRFKSFGLPGPSITPFLGNFTDFYRNNFQLHQTIDTYYKRYGRMFQFQYQGEATIVVAEEEVVKQILGSQFSKFHNRKFFVDLPWPCHKMITMATNKKWKSLRSVLSPAFTPGSLKKMRPLIGKAADTYLAKLEEASQKGSSIDIVNHSQGFVMETLLSIGFSLDSPNQSDFNKMLIKLVNNFTQPPWWVNLVATLPYGQHVVKHIPHAFKNNLQPFINTANEIVAGRRKEDRDEHLDLLDALLSAQKKDSSLKDEDLLAQGIVILTAVHVATSTTLALATNYIATHEHVKKKIMEEIDNIANEADFPSWDHVTENLKYLEQVLHETMRLYPSGFMLMRECTEACTIGNRKFEEGTGVLIPLYSMHRDKDIWDDPETFNPDRFSDGHNKGTHYIPFGEGPRICLGNRMSLIEMKLILAKLFSKYDVQADSSDKRLPDMIQSNVTVQAMMTLKEPILAKIYKRDHNVIS